MSHEKSQEHDLLSCGCRHCHSTVEENKTDFNNLKKSFFSLYGVEILKIATSFILLMVALFIMDKKFVSIILYLLAMIVCGFELIVKFIKSVIDGNFLDENTLMLIASATAFCLGEYFESVLVVVLFNTGELLERVATYGARTKIAGLSELKSDRVHLITKDGIIDVDPSEVPIGSLIEIKSGDRVPIDGVLIGLPTDFDMKAISGESKPYSVENGGKVYSGAINISNPVVIKTTKLFKDSTVEQMINMVEGSLSKKAISQKFITYFAKVYTPLVLLLALLISFIPPLFDQMLFVKWIYKGLSFLVISCPCALVISVPLGYFIGIGSLAKQGVLVKGSKYMETLAKVSVVAFDKTGTITEGQFVVDKVDAENGFLENDVLSLAYSLEINSSHPIAIAVCDYANDKVNLRTCFNVKEIPGRGLKGEIDNKNVLIGNEKLLTENGVELEKNESCYSILFVACDGKLVGKIILIDKVKKESKNAIYSLKKLGVKKTVILSGDNKEVVNIVASQVGVDKAYGELFPKQKLEKLNELCLNKNKIAYVGDGINDSPSLAAADVGIAMGGLGSEIAIESADVVVMNDKIDRIPMAICHSKKVRRIVLQNIIGSLFVKFSIMIISVVTFIPIWISMLADVGVMLLAVLNSLRNSRVCSC